MTQFQQTLTRSATWGPCKKTNVRLPSLQELEQTFATLAIFLELKTHRQFFRRCENSFLVENAIASILGMGVSVADREFTTDRAGALRLLQLFLDARFIEDAIHPEETKIWWEYGIYVVTPKGLHAARSQIQKHTHDGPNPVALTTSQPSCTQFLHLRRRESDDHILLFNDDLQDVFQCFTGAAPNFQSSKFKSLPKAEQYRVRSTGILLTPRPGTLVADTKSEATRVDACFSGSSAVDWLCDFTSVRNSTESRYLLAHFVRLGYIELVEHRPTSSDPRPAVVQKQGVDYSFVSGTKAIYRITSEGAQIAWDSEPQLGSNVNIQADAPPPYIGETSSESLPSYSEAEA